MAAHGKQDRPQRSGKSESDPVLHTRWWIDQGKPRERGPQVPNATAAGSSFFRVGIGYDQETARSRLTDLNLQLLAEGQPPPRGWGYLRMTPERFSKRTFEQIKSAVPLGSGVRALAVDSGVSMRVILTGEPPGERLLELRFGEESSFDAWVQGEWVEEALFGRLRDALKATPGFVTKYLPRSDRGTRR